MKQISSKSTFFLKKVFPLLWFGILAFGLAINFLVGKHEKLPPPAFIVPAIMIFFGYWLMKRLVWDLADAVYDCGDSLLVKNGPTETRVMLANIMNVSAQTFVNPPRITLRLRTPCALGNEISFSPTTSFSLQPFRKNAIAEDLILRVDQARTQGHFQSP